MTFNSKLTVFGFIPYIIISLLTLHFINEDAYIYFRVAENIANGHGYVFNIGSERIETGSSLPWQLIFALFALTPIHLLVWAKIVGIVLGCANLYLIYTISNSIFSNKSWVYYPVLATLSSLPFYMWMQLGLDAPLNTFFLLLLAHFLLQPNLEKYWHWAAIAVFYTRPEGFFYLIALLPYLVFSYQQKKPILKSIIVLLAGCLALVAFRLFYFHDLLPHAFYHKISLSLQKGGSVFFDYTIYNYLFILVLVLIVSLITKKISIKAIDKKPLSIIGSFTLITMIWAMIGYDWNGYNRHIGTFLPFFFISIFYLLSTLESSQFSKAGKVISIGFIILTLVTSKSISENNQRSFTPLLSSTINLLLSPETRYKEFASTLINPDFEEGKFRGASSSIGLHFMANLGRFLKLNYPDNSIVIWDQLGRTPWFAGSNFIFIDNTGLCHRDIGFKDYHQRIYQQNSKLHKTYESFINKLSSVLWPNEKRLKSEQEIIDEILAQQPAIIIARTSYLQKNQNSLLQKLIKQAEHFEKAHLIHNSYLIFENRNLLETKKAIIPRKTIVSSYIDGKLTPITTQQ